MDKLKKFAPAAALLGLCALIVSLRAHTYDEPLERDITSYAVIAHEMLNGKNLYSDLWDHKPPAIHMTYAAAECIAGYGRGSIFLMNAVAAVATLIACYFAGAAGGRGPIAGLIAATFWTLASGDLAIEGNQPNTEVFLNTLLTTAFFIFARAETKRIGIRGAALLGVLFAIASFYKQIVVLQAGFLCAAYFFCVAREFRKQALIDIAIVGAIGAAAWASLFGYLFAIGRGNAFVEAVFTYNRWYSAHPPRALNELWNWPGLSPDALMVAFAIAALALVGLIVGLKLCPRRGWLLLLAMAIATYITVQLPGWFFPHYYQLWLPPLVIGAAWGVELLRRTLPARFSWAGYAAAGVSCAVLVMMEAPCYLASAQSWSTQKYGGIFIESEQLAAKIDNLVPRDAGIYEWGNETGFYFNTHRDPPSGLIFAYPIQAGPLAPKLCWRLMHDLKSKTPELVVTANLTMSLTPDHPVARWVEANYRLLWQTNSFSVMVRKGSELDRTHPVAAAK
jgi:4-amino-4-deoxy-L-arabinose transferase-like glycosyltransferase